MAVEVCLPLSLHGARAAIGKVQPLWTASPTSAGDDDDDGDDDIRGHANFGEGRPQHDLRDANTTCARFEQRILFLLLSPDRQ